jgi:hypothetical protein
MNESNRTSPRLMIVRVRVTRRNGAGLALDLVTQSGLNVIVGDNSTGRTTLLKLLEFGLGAHVQSVSQFFIPEIEDCERVVIEAELNGVSYTFERKFRNQTQIKLYQGSIDQVLHENYTHLSVGEELSSFLLNRLMIPRVSLVDEYGRERAISFNDLFDGLYIDQEVGFSRIYERIRTGAKRRNVFKLLTGISNPDLFAVGIEEGILRKRHDSVKQDLDSIASFLGTIQLPTIIEIDSEEVELEKRKEVLTSQLNGLREQLRARPDYANPLRNEVLALDAKVASKQRDILFTQQSIRSYIELENQLSEDLDRAQRIRISSQQLSTFEFQRCPRCLQEVTSEMAQRENNDKCGLCGRSLQSNDSDDVGQLDGYERQINYQLAELEELRKYYTLSAEQIGKDLSIVQGELVLKRKALDEAVEQYVSPLFENIQSLGYEIAHIDERLSTLTTHRNWQERLNLKRNELTSINSDLSKLLEKKNELLELERMQRGELLGFEEYFRFFISDIYPGYESAYLNEDFMPVINEYAYFSKSTTQRNIAILGYYYALLRFSIEHSTYIPRFLVIDTIRQDDLEQGLYEKVLHKFKVIHDKFHDQFQMFLVVRDKTSLLEDVELLRLMKGQYLLNVSQ